MIKCKNSPPIPAVSTKIEVALFSDTKEEIKDNVEQMTIEGFPTGYDIAMSSSVTTADGHFAFRKSDGTWNWIA